MYARVTGTLKQFGTKKYLNLAHIQPVTDPHELFFHLFEAGYVTMVYSRGLVSSFLEPVHPSNLVPLSLAAVVVVAVSLCRE